MSSHSNNSDEVILAQKAELEEKNRVIGTDYLFISHVLNYNQTLAYSISVDT